MKRHLCAVIVVAVLGAAAVLTLPGFAAVAAERTVLTTSAIDFTTLVCSATNVGNSPLTIRIQMLSPHTGEPLFNSVTETATLEPGFGASNELQLAAGFTPGYCRFIFSGPPVAVRAAACSKDAQNGGCQGVSEAR